jgi:hypothetical protein
MAAGDLGWEAEVSGFREIVSVKENDGVSDRRHPFLKFSLDRAFPPPDASADASCWQRPFLDRNAVLNLF